MQLTKRERLQATIAGQTVDRPAVALWRHWPGDDQRPDDQARAHMRFQKEYDFDLIKVTPSSGYTVKDWGVDERYLGNTEGTCEHGQLRIQSAGGLAESPTELDPTQGTLGGQLRCLDLIAGRWATRCPLFRRSLTPYRWPNTWPERKSCACICGATRRRCTRHCETITASIVAFVRQVMRTGAAGLFYAVQHAQYGVLTEEEYRPFGRPYDRQVLAAAERLVVQRAAFARQRGDVRPAGRLSGAGDQLARPRNNAQPEPGAHPHRRAPCAAAGGSGKR